MGKRIGKIIFGLLTPMILLSCSAIPSRVYNLKSLYDGNELTHAYWWDAKRPDFGQHCAYLYRDNRIDTPDDDWIPFYQGLTLKIGEEELLKRRNSGNSIYDNNLFSKKEAKDYCHEIDNVEFQGVEFDHRQVALPEEAEIRLKQLKEDYKNQNPEKSLDFLNNLKIHYSPRLF
jgi:hypothetical protein